MNQNMFSVKVSRKALEAQDICTFELVDPAGEPLPPFSAGSHIDVEVKPGLVRQYSLCNDPAESDRYLIGVLRDPSTRGGSAGMHDLVQQGDTIRIGSPRNHFALAHGAQRSLLLAGGIGVTPILCMAERLSMTGADFAMYYCTRSRSRTAFFERIKASDFTERVHFHFDDGGAEQKLDIPALLSGHDAQTHLYVCGPSGFLDFVVATARVKGWSEANIHFEYFAAKVEHSGDHQAFEVQLASSGRVIPVPADQSVIEALANAGIEVPFSCEQGVCGTCLTRVLDGEPEHKDMYLTESERSKNDQFLPCCSRAKSRLLVLDL